ncbi:hypothetical protein NP493_32g01028 [Ridgeia piscesae]|uniref:Agmatinase n=1 Tax=Ridgeia piscesae TaxID=27915 RepID=A0AAD9PCM1_RIDPI|nr:hypothetical protein NP493_32g01028 [Ridgeia piscesae]
MQTVRFIARGLKTSAKLLKAAAVYPDSAQALISRCSPAAVRPAVHQVSGVCPNRRPSGWLSTRRLADSTTNHVKFNEPIPANDLPRTAGICSMYRLPVVPDSNGLDVCFIGVPLDQGTSNRSGTRFGPRQIRSESPQVRRFNQDTGASPYDSLQVADVGDVNMTIYDIEEAARNIRDTFSYLLSTGYRCKILHGTPIRRAVEEGLIDSHRTVQIGIRSSVLSFDDIEWTLDQGFRVVPANHYYHKSMAPLMEEVRQMMGDKPVYISFDIDALDPSFAPGTGTPEIGGLTTIQVLEIIRGCRGLNIVGGDLVEVSPPYDQSGNTALTAACFLFEMLCIFPRVKYVTMPARLG